MLNENIKRLRKNKGCTQETLAEQLGVVRQTISKWEKGFSVPDADLLLNAVFVVPGVTAFEQYRVVDRPVEVIEQTQ